MAAERPNAPNAASGKTQTSGQPGQSGGAATSGGRKPPAPNRAQIKAMEARAASTARATAIARGEDADSLTSVTRSSTGTRTPRTRTREGLRTTNRAASSATAAEFSIRDEMIYQRRDLIRLLIIAAIVLAVFVVLLFVLH